MLFVPFLRLGRANAFYRTNFLTFIIPKFKNFEQCRTIVNKVLLKLPDDYPEPWDYKEHGLGFFYL